MDMLEASSRVALAALLHDLGKFAERARVGYDTEYSRQNDCPQWNGHPTHIHAAYTSAAFAALEAARCLPERQHLMGAPFGQSGSGREDDSLINAAARHHRPGTALQWIIATADRLASGFERSRFSDYNEQPDPANHYQTRLLSLPESLRLDKKTPQKHAWVQPLKALSPNSIFPQLKTRIQPTDNATAQQEYLALWQQFVRALGEIPAAHRQNLPLWLDHFDSAWLAFTHAIPSATAGGTCPDVSLYDHSKAVAALAVALWQWHEDRNEPEHTTAERLRQLWDKERAETQSVIDEQQTEKFLLIQGDFAGIQDFIFAEGSQTQQQAAKLLRGRSFQVSLLCELAALAVLEALQLPATSQIINAAGKFLIVAPNTATARSAIAQVQATLNQWFLKETFGECGFGLALLPATQADFTQNAFPGLVRRLFAQQEAAKLRRFDLCNDQAPAAVRPADFGSGPCAFDGRRPAETIEKKGERQIPASWLASDQIAIGRHLSNPQFDRLLLARSTAPLWQSGSVKPLSLDYFGFRVAFVRNEEGAGKFGELARQGGLLRCWDFHLPGRDEAEVPLFRGYARRDINAYVPLFDEKTLEWDSGRYRQWEGDALELFDKDFPVKTLNHLACEDRLPTDETLEKWQGITALAVLKGDVDNLGSLFQRGIQPVTFARMAALSRQLNSFFAIHLPWRCAHDFTDTYTVFAGGDDFFLIGPWYRTQKLAQQLAADFSRYMAENPELHFSAGITLAKPGIPIRALAENAESALEAAKAHPDPEHPQKNAITCHQATVDWEAFFRLNMLEDQLETFRKDYGMSTGFIYRLLYLAEMAESKVPEDAIWQSWLAYRVRRFVVDRLPHDKRDAAQIAIAGTLRHALQNDKLAVRIPVANHLYRYRT